MGVDEILVHISDRSTKKKDDQYRAMAQACDTFESARTIIIDKIHDSSNSVLHETDGPERRFYSTTSATEVSIAPETPQVLKRRVADLYPDFIEDTQLARAAIESQSWLEAPFHVWQAKSAFHLRDEENRIIKKRRLCSKDSISGNGSLNADSADRDSSACQVQETEDSCVERLTDVAAPSCGSESGLRDSGALYMESPPTTGSSLNASSPRNDVSRGSKAHADGAGDTVDPSWVQKYKALLKQDVELFNFEASGDLLPSSHSWIVSEARAADNRSKEKGNQRLFEGSFSSVPPLPEASVLSEPQPDNHGLLSEALIKLNSNPSLSSNYKPRHVKRDLRPFERGHWLVASWLLSPEIRQTTWNFISKFAKDGRGGWGLWCTRDIHEEEGISESVGSERHALTTRESFRLYCWGCAVQHCYLLLYVASKSKIRRCNQVRWIDAAGETVIAM